MQAHTLLPLSLAILFVYLPSSFSKLILLHTFISPVLTPLHTPSYTPLLLPASCSPCSLSPVPFNSNFLLYSMKGIAVCLYSQQTDCITAPPVQSIGPFKEIYPKSHCYIREHVKQMIYCGASSFISAPGFDLACTLHTLTTWVSICVYRLLGSHLDPDVLLFYCTIENSGKCRLFYFNIITPHLVKQPRQMKWSSPSVKLLDRVLNQSAHVYITNPHSTMDLC